MFLSGGTEIHPGPELWLNNGDKTFTKDISLPSSLTDLKGVSVIGDHDNSGR